MTDLNAPGSQAAMLAAEEAAQRAHIATLQWSEVAEPNEQIRYTHVLAESPLGRFSIEWKSWKPHDSYCVHLDGDYLDTAMNLDDAKAIALKKVADMAHALAGYVASVASAPVADERADDILTQVYHRFGIGVLARNPSTLMACLGNVIRRAHCLSQVEQVLSVPTPPEPEDDGVWGEESLLRWGADEKGYAEHFKAALAEWSRHAALASAPVAGEAQPVAWANEDGDPISDALKQARLDLYGKNYTRPLVYAAPQAREAAHSLDAAADLLKLAAALGNRNWKWWDSCSFRRLTFEDGPDRRDGGALCGWVQPSYGHPDVSMAPGVREFIEAASPKAIAALAAAYMAALSTQPSGNSGELSAQPGAQKKENRVGTNTGHGHAWRRPDGYLARCGGPAICRECAQDLAQTRHNNKDGGAVYG
ncbi:hypothetical protein [Achromobacter sp.]|uniref:hypothetical protein n=1 Tax=Achromobacter sp. TaxID=134375 RepID=UPI003C77F63F